MNDRHISHSICTISDEVDDVRRMLNIVERGKYRDVVYRTEDRWL